MPLAALICIGVRWTPNWQGLPDALGAVLAELQRES
jgi:hypothetical protein